MHRYLSADSIIVPASHVICFFYRFSSALLRSSAMVIGGVTYVRDVYLGIRYVKEGMKNVHQVRTAML